MPVYNGSQYLPGAMAQITNICGPQDEIIVIDDQSSDGSETLLKQWVAKNPQVKIFQNPGKGLVAALNFGIDLCSHEWIARVDVDDRYLPSRIDDQVGAITEDVVVIFSDYEVFEEGRGSLGYIPTAISPPYVYLSLIASQRTPHPVALIRKSAVLKVGGYRSEDFPAEDLHLWFKLGRIGKLISIPKPLLNYQISPASISSSKALDMGVKRNEVISAQTLSVEVWREALANLDSTLTAYKNYPEFHLRQALLIRDLFLWIRWKRLSGLPVILRAAIPIFLKPNSVYALFRGWRESRVRRLVRGSLK